MKVAGVGVGVGVGVVWCGSGCSWVQLGAGVGRCGQVGARCL